MASREEDSRDVSWESAGVSLAQIEQELAEAAPGDKNIPQLLHLKGVYLGLISIRTSDPVYLRESRATLTAAADLLEEDDPSLIPIVSSLADACEGLIEYTGPSLDLLEQRATARRILFNATANESEIADAAAHLGLALSALATARPTDITLLRESVAAWERSLQDLRPNSASMRERQMGLAMTLCLIASSDDATPAELKKVIRLIQELKQADCQHPNISALVSSEPLLISALASALNDYSLAEQAFHLRRSRQDYEDSQELWDDLSSYALLMMSFARTVDEFSCGETAFIEAYNRLNPSHPDRDLLVSKYAVAAFTQLAIRPPLPKLVDLLRDSMSHCIPESPIWAQLAWHLANALQFQYESTSEEANLREAITLQRKIMPLLLKSQEGLRAAIAFSGMLGEWYQAKDEVAVLREAIEILKTATASVPDTDANLIPALSNLGVLILMSPVEDDGEAILVLRRALALCPADHPERPGLILNFAEALAHPKAQAAAHTDGQEILPLLQGLLDFPPPDIRLTTARVHLAMAKVLLSIADAEDADVTLLERALSHAQEVRRCSEGQTPFEPVAVELYATLMRRLAQAKGDRESLEEGLTRCRELASDPSVTLLAQLQAAEECIKLATALKDADAIASASIQLVSLCEKLLLSADNEIDYENARTGLNSALRALTELAASSGSVNHISLLARAMRAFRSNRHVVLPPFEPAAASASRREPLEDPIK